MRGSSIYRILAATMVVVFAGIAGFAGITGSAFAQAPAGPPPADPSRVEERFRQQPERPQLGAPVEVPSAPEQAAPEGAEAVKFQIAGVIFEGNTTLPEERLQRIAADYLNREISLADVYDLASQVTAAYRDEGYILTRAIVPAQRIEDGQLHIRIVEGFIDKVDIEGDAGGARKFLEKQARRIAAARPLTADVLERELLLAGDLSGLTVRSVLTPSETTPGAADLTLVVERDRVEGLLAVDNLGSRFLGREEVRGGIFLNDLLGTASRVGLIGVITPHGGPELAYGALSIQQPLTSTGLSLFVSLSYLETEPGLDLKAIDTRGKAKTARAEFSYPFIRSRDLNVIGTAGFYASDIESKNSLIDPLFKDKVRNVSVRVFANALDSYGGSNTAEVSFTQGITALGGSKKGDPNLSRVNADSNYQRLNFEVTRWQPFGSRFGLLLGVAGQTSFGEDLLASEEFGLGSTFYGRAYDPSEITGEKGIAGKAELRWFLPNLPYAASVTSNTYFYCFFEGGVVGQVTVLPGEESSQTIKSAGVGVRTAIADNLTLDFYVAKPIGRVVLGEGDRDLRVFFSLTVLV